MIESKAKRPTQTVYLRPELKQECLDYCNRHTNSLDKPMGLSEMVRIGLIKVLEEEK